ncbi:hypothetical protein BKA70DRAFT_656 [Coprinopsis sp. MPI-PUGE-AT-0042]|nr:hypothetical protein BKA70DRAFT_656 [Coprinopsis sp. MPI-PUGE-AT-0042]
MALAKVPSSKVSCLAKLLIVIVALRFSVLERAVGLLEHRLRARPSYHLQHGFDSGVRRWHKATSMSFVGDRRPPA